MSMYEFVDQEAHDSVEPVFVSDRKELSNLISYFMSHANMGGRLCKEFKDDFYEAIDHMEEASRILWQMQEKF